MTTYTWKINDLACYQEFEGKSNAVFRAAWLCVGEEDSYTHRFGGSTELTINSADAFTPYEQLTEAQVLGWVWEAGVDKTKTEEIVQAGINEQKTSLAVVAPALPWQTD